LDRELKLLALLNDNHLLFQQLMTCTISAYPLFFFIFKILNFQALGLTILIAGSMRVFLYSQDGWKLRCKILFDFNLCGFYDLAVKPSIVSAQVNFF